MAFSAVVIDTDDSGQTVALKQLDDSELTEGDVTIIAGKIRDVVRVDVNR